MKDEARSSRRRTHAHRRAHRPRGRLPTAPRARAALVALALWAVGAGAAHGFEQQLQALVSLRGVAADGETSWLDRGLGKLRFDDRDEPLALGAVALDYRAVLLPTVTAHATATAYGDGQHVIDLDEAYLAWRPVPHSSWKWQLRGGAFHAPFSLENTDIGWTSPYTVSSSALNSWFGEELRTIGGEVQLTHLGAPAGSPHDVSVVGALFRANDPAGALLSWRGWAIGDRQTGLTERLPLADLPAFRPTGSFPPQGDFEEPFHEIDERTGWYAGVQWDYLQRSRLRLQRYDNRGNPAAIDLYGQQWAWRTEFDHAGWQLRLPGDVELIAQYAWGSTEMDGYTGPLVYADFDAGFLLLSRAFGRQRLSARYDDFAVSDQDTTPDDPNAEHGHAWTLAWFLQAGDWAGGHWRVGAEGLQVDSWRPARRLLGDAPSQRERQLQLVLEWRR
jgi:hypothetical protein